MTRPLDLAEKVRKACRPYGGTGMDDLDLSAIVAEWEADAVTAERGAIVAWLLSQAFERRFSPKDAEPYRAAAESIRAGEHYTDTGRVDPQPRTYTEAEVREACLSVWHEAIQYAAKGTCTHETARLFAVSRAIDAQRRKDGGR